MADQDPLESGEVLAFLKSFSEPGSSGAGYLEDHLKRFVETLQLLPRALPGAKLLELGAAYHHITPAFRRFRGYEAITCTDLWEGDPRLTRTIRSQDGAFAMDVAVDNFDVEKVAAYPYEDGEFDVVVCCEILEHLSHDPMHMLREINRILKTGGHVLLTTPNLASAKSFSYILQGQSPYIWGQYPVGGRGTDRHNREYTALEVKKILELSGFRMEVLRTGFSWWPVDPKVFDLMSGIGMSAELRGDNTMALGVRSGPPQARWPAEFYHGGEVGRELPQEAPGATASASTAQAAPITEVAGKDPNALRVLVVNNIVPNHDRGGSCYRMMTLLKLLVEEGHGIEYLGRDAKGMEKYVRDVEELGIKVHGTDPVRLRVWDDVPGDPLDLARILREGSFDVAVLLLWLWSSPSIPEQYLHEIRKLSPKTRIVVLSDDVHWLHDARMADVTGARSDLERALGYRPRELEIFRRADLVAAITEDDAKLMREEDETLKVEILPHFVPPREGPSPGFEPRRDLIAVGAFGYFANVDSVTWFVREIWPMVRAELPGVRFHIVGGSPPQSVRDLACEDVVVAGWVQDIVAELDRRRVFVSTIRYGTGLKTKNIQAMGAGLPVVGTTISLAGSGATAGTHAIVADDPRTIAKAIVRLYTDEDAWTRQAIAARRFADASFGKAATRRAIRHTLHTAAALTPSRKDPGPAWSITEIEKRDPGILNAATSSDRFRLRLTAHLKAYGDHHAAGRHEEGLAELRRVLAHCGQGAFKQNPQFFAGVLCRFGETYRALGRTEEAAACYREALALDPSEEDALRGLREFEPDAALPKAALRPRPIPIEGRRGFAFLSPALDATGWEASLDAFLREFRPEDDVCLLLLGPPDRLEAEVLAWLRAHWMDPASIPDVVVVPAPADLANLPRYVAAADAVLTDLGRDNAVLDEARRQGLRIFAPGGVALRELAFAEGVAVAT